MLSLIFPNISHKTSYLDMIEEWKSYEAPSSPGALFRGENFEEFLELAVDDMTSNRFWVPATLFFLMDWDRILGAIQIRHHIDHPRLKEYGWHIGNGIRPSERRKWYAREMLNLALDETRELWIERVLICCYDDNPGSYKVIESNEGTFDRYTEYEWKKSRRYWITL